MAFSERIALCRSRTLILQMSRANQILEMACVAQGVQNVFAGSMYNGDLSMLSLNKLGQSIMRTLIIGANGYVGSAVARSLKAHGASVSGLSRGEEFSAKMASVGIEPVEGKLTDIPALKEIAAGYDAIVFTPVIPFEEEGPALDALLWTFRGSNKPFIFTSGTGVLSIESRDGQWHQESFSEDDPYVGQHWLKLRVETEDLVRKSAHSGVRAIVVRPPQIWGHGDNNFRYCRGRATWLVQTSLRTRSRSVCGGKKLEWMP